VVAGRERELSTSERLYALAISACRRLHRAFLVACAPPQLLSDPERTSTTRSTCTAHSRSTTYTQLIGSFSLKRIFFTSAWGCSRICSARNSSRSSKFSKIALFRAWRRNSSNNPSNNSDCSGVGNTTRTCRQYRERPSMTVRRTRREQAATSLPRASSCRCVFIQ
jgi:hypothetical protein